MVVGFTLIVGVVCPPGFQAKDPPGMLVLVVNTVDCPAQMVGFSKMDTVGIGLMVTDKLAVVAHWPLVGVKEYEVVVVALIAGDQEPVKPSILELGKEKEAPAQ